MKGFRKLIVFAVSVGALLAGFTLCAFFPAIIPAFATLATGIAAVTAAAMAGNVGEHLAQRGQSEPGGKVLPLDRPRGYTTFVGLAILIALGFVIYVVAMEHARAADNDDQARGAACRICFRATKTPDIIEVSSPVVVKRDASGKIARDPTVVRLFLRSFPPPAWCLTAGKYDGKKCEVDHKRPLCAGGKDEIANLVYQPRPFAAISDKWEADFCRKLKACGVVK